MDNLDIKFRTAGKALPPRPIKTAVPGWGGSALKKRENGSDPQPWHCAPFGEGATYGLELIYQYETECHVVNDTGQIRIDWDYAREPGGVVGFDEFSESAPRPSQFYIFATSLDLQAPTGYVLRTEPHPRFFTDATGTVPVALCGHVQTQWWPKKLFVVFKAPAPGQRHIFRKGEPYVQILFVPAATRYEPTAMSPAEAARREELERGILLAKSLIAKQVWHSPDGLEFNDHYKVLTRTFEREGAAGVEAAVHEAVARYQEAVPQGKTMAEYLNLAIQYQREGKFLEAKLLLFHTQSLEPNNAEAGNRMAMIGWSWGLHQFALSAMQRAVALLPRSPAYHANLGEMLRRLDRYPEAEASFRTSLELNPHDAQTLGIFGFVLAAQGRVAEGLEACRTALAIAPRKAIVHFMMGSILAKQHQYREARGCYNTALTINPGLVDVQRALQELPADASP